MTVLPSAALRRLPRIPSSSPFVPIGGWLCDRILGEGQLGFDFLINNQYQKVIPVVLYTTGRSGLSLPTTVQPDTPQRDVSPLGHPLPNTGRARLLPFLYFTREKTVPKKHKNSWNIRQAFVSYRLRLLLGLPPPPHRLSFCLSISALTTRSIACQFSSTSTPA